jgi:Family of unknown function (DUF5677)
MSVTESSLIVGIPEEWKHFKQRNERFLQRFHHLESALNIAFGRKIAESETIDRIIYFTGRLCAEDFNEIYLLCGNGYGIAALKLVRGLFERTVTVRYLSMHPEEAADYLDYHWVRQHKLLKAIDETFGPELLPQEKREEIEREFQLVRDRFLISDCKECKTTRVNHTWNKLDIVAMAKRVGEVGKLIVPAYYTPLREAHATVEAIFSRLDPNQDGLFFDGGPQRKVADQALITAHNLILNNLELQKDHFKLTNLEEPLQQCLQDFLDIWGTPNAIRTPESSS